MSTDTFLELPLRLAGYGYGYNEAAKYAVDYERLLITMANLYIFCHVGFKAFEANDITSAALICLDTLVFHLIASVVVPLFTGNIVRSLVHELMHNIRASPRLHRWAPVIIVVAVLIIISRPLDNVVNKIMDATLRKVLKK
ncbi:mitochondrial fission process protein 1-like isoform X1 [Biomphalaria glabrata]|uniref:Mitochondrial fission process protein 1 n=1 Tax=Biomphalaria glabrata TaxID=6526 RepID=A0A9W2YFZ9_BIOGL|nr:mitochondrial fission process protein 1-like isoform X1 [Biomphalaria glabrata]